MQHQNGTWTKVLTMVVGGMSVPLVGIGGFFLGNAMDRIEEVEKKVQRNEVTLASRDKFVDMFQHYLEQTDSIDGRVKGMASSLAKLEQSVHDHNEEARYWKEIIEWVRGEIANVYSSVHQLRTDATARKDPFTGTEGRLLERRIDYLELAVKSVENVIERLTTVESKLGINTEASQ